MSNSISLEVKGFADVLRKMQRYVSTSEDKVESVIANTVENIASDARTNCDVPSIANEIHTAHESGYYLVRTDTPISAYREFGTGNYAAVYVPTLPQDFQELALSFYINGLGRMPAKPYLLPAYNSNTANIKNEILKVL